MAKSNVQEIKTPEEKAAPMPKSFDEAMLAFQQCDISASKKAKNPHFGSAYSTLEEVMTAARHANKFGLYFIQPLEMMMFGDTIVQVAKTIVTHAPSGESRECICPVRVKDPTNPQHMGSGITYAKRYGLQAIFGLPSEDDDGNAASTDIKKPSRPTNDDNNKPAMGDY